MIIEEELDPKEKIELKPKANCSKCFGRGYVRVIPQHLDPDKYRELRPSWYVHLIDELKDLITETEFTSRWTLVEGYHSLGSRILQENDNFERAKIYGQGICNAIAESLGKRSRTIYYAVQFAREYPDLNLLPEGKNISWSHIVNKYLTDGTEKKTVKKSDLYRMIKEIKELLNTEYLKTNNGELDQYYQPYIRYLQDQVNKITGGLDGQ